MNLAQVKILLKNLQIGLLQLATGAPMALIWRQWYNFRRSWYLDLINHFTSQPHHYLSFGSLSNLFLYFVWAIENIPTPCRSSVVGGLTAGFGEDGEWLRGSGSAPSYVLFSIYLIGQIIYCGNPILQILKQHIAWFWQRSHSRPCVLTPRSAF